MKLTGPQPENASLSASESYPDALSPLRTWLFDLDNTLHNASPHIFPHINRSMTAYLMQHLELDEPAANRLRVDYWRRYGATLLGLMRHHGTDPRHFLHDTHQFPDLARMVVFDNALHHMLARLPGRKIVFSNGPSRYAEAVLEIMGIRRHFEDVYAVEQMRFNPKPGMTGFRHLLKDHPTGLGLVARTGDDRGAECLHDRFPVGFLIERDPDHVYLALQTEFMGGKR